MSQYQKRLELLKVKFRHEASFLPFLTDFPIISAYENKIPQIN